MSPPCLHPIWKVSFTVEGFLWTYRGTFPFTTGNHIEQIVMFKDVASPSSSFAFVSIYKPFMIHLSSNFPDWLHKFFALLTPFTCTPTFICPPIPHPPFSHLVILVSCSQFLPVRGVRLPHWLWRGGNGERFVWHGAIQLLWRAHGRGGDGWHGADLWSHGWRLWDLFWLQHLSSHCVSVMTIMSTSG